MLTCLKKLAKKCRLNGRRRGLTLVEILTSMVIIAVTATAVTIGFYTSYTMLEIEKRKHIAIKYLEEEMDYWRLRVHTGNIDSRDLNGNSNDTRDFDFTVLDGADALINDAEVWCERIEAYDDIRTTSEIDWYNIKCKVKYTEKYIDPFGHYGSRSRQQKVEYVLDSSIIPANI